MILPISKKLCKTKNLANFRSEPEDYKKIISSHSRRITERFIYQKEAVLWYF